MITPATPDPYAAKSAATVVYTAHATHAAFDAIHARPCIATKAARSADLYAAQAASAATVVYTAHATHAAL